MVCESWPQFGDWNDVVGIRNVAAVGAVYRDFGIDRYVMAGAVETWDGAARLQDALVVDELVICGLYAPIEVSEDRLRSRIRSDTPYSWYRDRALVMLERFAQDGLDNLTIDTANKEPRAIGEEIARFLGWNSPARPMLPA